MLNRAAGRTCSHSVPSLVERSGACEYICEINGHIDNWTFNCRNSELEK